MPAPRGAAVTAPREDGAPPEHCPTCIRRHAAKFDFLHASPVHAAVFRRRTVAMFRAARLHERACRLCGRLIWRCDGVFMSSDLVPHMADCPHVARAAASATS